MMFTTWQTYDEQTDNDLYVETVQINFWRMMRIVYAFGNALRGLRVFFSSERNGKIQLLAAVIAVVMGVGYHIPRSDWMWVVACIATVLSFEMLNSAIEKICDLVQPEFHPAVKNIKDISAAAVLWSAVFSAIIGAFIFLPKIL